MAFPAYFTGFSTLDLVIEHIFITMVPYFILTQHDHNHQPSSTSKKIIVVNDMVSYSWITLRALTPRRPGVMHIDRNKQESVPVAVGWCDSVGGSVQTRRPTKYPRRCTRKPPNMGELGLHPINGRGFPSRTHVRYGINEDLLVPGVVKKAIPIDADRIYSIASILHASSSTSDRNRLTCS